MKMPGDVSLARSRGFKISERADAREKSTRATSITDKNLAREDTTLINSDSR